MTSEAAQKLRGPDDPVAAFIGLGSNIGDRPGLFREAIRLMDRLPGTTVAALSPLYYTDPVEIDGEEFLNGVAHLQTTLAPERLWISLEKIELILGRTAKGEKRPRTIDLDLLVHGTHVVDSPSLSIPHPRMAGRAFVLRPFNDLAPEVMIPPGNRTVAQLWGRLVDKGGVRPATDLEPTEIMSATLIDEGRR